MVHWQDAQGIFIASELQNRKFGETQIYSENCFNITAVERHLLLLGMSRAPNEAQK